jgi:hypothetical protein
METAFSVFPGSTVAVCEYADGQGDVVPVDRGESAEDKCSVDGAISPSRVVAVIEVP